MTLKMPPGQIPANENGDPYATVESALDYLYRLRREALQLDLKSMTLDQHRHRQDVLASFPEVEKSLLALL